MRRSIIMVMAALGITATLAWAAQKTPKLNLNRTNSADMNANFDKIDNILGNMSTCSMVFTTAQVNPTEAGATHDYMSFRDGAGSTTEANEDDFIVPQDVRAVRTHCVVATAPGAGNDSWKVDIRDDGATVSGHQCEIDETATTCTVTTTSANIASGSRINYIVDSSGSDADPDANALIECSTCFTATY